ncbi:MAG TPA: sulfurtransferase TusA family protein [Candidatus Limnocylindrales bacterium]|jgi:tRNA 2-thiouridine synthesizing protein A
MATIAISHTIDARGLSCPMPIVKTAQACRVVAAGSLVELLATDPGSTKDVAAWCRATGNELVEQSADGAVYRFIIRRK